MQVNKVNLLAYCALLLMTLLSSNSYALIEGGDGNDPVQDPGWPKGAAEIFNHKGRIAYWIGPPYGGGQWHAECKGNATVVNEVLKQFAKIEGKKRIVVHDGLGYSFWLDPNGTKRGDRNTKIDWSLTVWEPKRWQFQKDLAPGLSAIDKNQNEPHSQIDIYTAAVLWSDIQVPEGLDVEDNRMSIHGFQLSDGRVIEGTITDSTNKPLRGKIRIEEIVPKKAGGYDYRELKLIETDDAGHWVVKNFGTQWCRVIAECDGFASRVIGHVRYDRQPGWASMPAQLAPRGRIEGFVVNEAGKPLADVQVAMRDLSAMDDNRYETVGEVFQTTDTNGKFVFENIPHGKARLTGHREDHYSPGRGQSVTIPGEPTKLVMSSAAKLIINVEFSGARGDKQYIAELTPEGGHKVGSWGGSAQIGLDNSAEFKGIPPGKYELCVHPNPSSETERNKTQTIELKGGDVTKVVVKQSVD